MKDLLGQVGALRREQKEREQQRGKQEWGSGDVEDAGEGTGPEKRESELELWACRFNSGRFGVPWEETRGVVERVMREEKEKGNGTEEVGLVVVKEGGRGA